MRRRKFRHYSFPMHLMFSYLSVRSMRGAAIAALLWAVLSALPGSSLPATGAQTMDDSIVSKHVRLRLPMERQWLGRASISDLENCWSFMNSATNARLPGRVMVVLDLQNATAGVDFGRGTISIGLADLNAEKDPRGFLIHAAAREMARMVLMTLSDGGAAKAENRFLLEGLSEMLAHEYASSVRKLTSAWAVAYYQDRIQPLSLTQLATNAPPAVSRHSLHAAAPGITLLTTATDLYGRQRVLRVFELLGKRNFNDAVALAFKTTPAALEEHWLERVRKYDPADITVTPENAVPVLDRITFEPDPGQPAAPLSIRIDAHDGGQDLAAEGIYLVDEASGRVVNARLAGTATQHYAQGQLTIEPDRKEGQYKIRVIAIDEAGNVRNWEAAYQIKAKF